MYNRALYVFFVFFWLWVTYNKCGGSCQTSDGSSIFRRLSTFVPFCEKSIYCSFPCDSSALRLTGAIRYINQKINNVNMNK